MDEPDLGVAALAIAGQLRRDVVVPSRSGPDLDHQGQRFSEGIERPRVIRKREHQGCWNDDDIGDGVLPWRVARLAAIDVDTIDASIELALEQIPEMKRYVVVLHAHQRLLYEHAVPQL